MAMADTPQSLSPVEPLHQVEQAVSLNQRIERNKEQTNRRNPRRRRRPVTEEKASGDDTESQEEQSATEELPEGRIDYRA